MKIYQIMCFSLIKGDIYKQSDLIYLNAKTTLGFKLSLLQTVFI